MCPAHPSRRRLVQWGVGRRLEELVRCLLSRNLCGAPYTEYFLAVRTRVADFLSFEHWRSNVLREDLRQFLLAMWHTGFFLSSALTISISPSLLSVNDLFTCPAFLLRMLLNPYQTWLIAPRNLGRSPVCAKAGLGPKALSRPKLLHLLGIFPHQ